MAEALFYGESNSFGVYMDLSALHLAMEASVLSFLPYLL
mgnify:CR=1 FL=1